MGFIRVWGTVSGLTRVIVSVIMRLAGLLNMLTQTRSPSKKSFSRACSPKRSKGPYLGHILLSVQVSMQELQGPFLCLGSFGVECPPDCCGFPKLGGVPLILEGPHNKDYRILGSILGPPYFGKLPYPVVLIGMDAA